MKLHGSSVVVTQFRTVTYDMISQLVAGKAIECMTSSKITMYISQIIHNEVAWFERGCDTGSHCHI
jgi:uncharacterized Zn-binding protein involved in type VI secretion